MHNKRDVCYVGKFGIRFFRPGFKGGYPTPKLTGVWMQGLTSLRVALDTETLELTTLLGVSDCVPTRL